MQHRKRERKGVQMNKERIKKTKNKTPTLL